MLTPTRSLLFRYSALTFNAHLIHLDKDYAKTIEGHRNLLVHGPLSLTLMLQALAGYVKAYTKGRHVLESIEYRNLAPLYCDEEMRICGMEKKTFTDGGVYEVWIEGPTGGVAVRGTVYTTADPRNKASQKPPLVQGTNQFTVHYVNGRDTSITPATNRDKPPSRKTKKAEKKQKDKAKATSGAPTLVRRSAFRSVIVSTSDPSSRDLSETGTNQLDPSPKRRPPRDTHRSPQRPYLSAFHLPSLSDRKSEEQSLSVDAALGPSINQTRPSSTQRTSRAHRRNRLARSIPARTHSYTESSPSVRRIQAAPSPMIPRLSLQAQRILRRSSRRSSRPFFVEPIPVLRTYRGKAYQYDAAAVASRHSRYRKDGPRRVEHLYVRHQY
jgi:hypothetical protein